jgi:hypothetical protein
MAPQLPTPASVASTSPANSSRPWRGYVHAAATLALAATVAGDLASRSAQPQAEKAKTAEAKPDAKPETKPEAPADAQHERDIRDAWEIEEPADRAKMKRLLYLYRGTLKAAQKAKTIGELKTWFDAEEARLGMKGILPHLRTAVAKQWPAAVASSTEISDGMRGQIVAFFEKRIGVLEKF